MNDKASDPRYFRLQAAGQGRRVRTRAALIDGVIQLVASQGMVPLSVADITAAAEVSHGTFYNHFDSRDALFIAAGIAVGADVERHALLSLGPLPAGVERMVAVIDAVIRELVVRPAHAAMFVGTVARYREVNAFFTPKLRQDVQAAHKQGVLTERVTALVADQVGALIGVGIATRLRTPRARQVNRDTCIAILRLLGHTAKNIGDVVDAALKR